MIGEKSGKFSRSIMTLNTFQAISHPKDLTKEKILSAAKVSLTVEIVSIRRF